MAWAGQLVTISRSPPWWDVRRTLRSLHERSYRPFRLRRPQWMRASKLPADGRMLHAETARPERYLVDVVRPPNCSEVCSLGYY
jgi:hypothetical protein